ncbi:MAG: hypothetical protein FWD78_12120 [Treponema sp.]|nr:hypothetical protein [Treponema sp.]
MKEMTDKEAEYLNNYYTENTIMPDLSKPGFFSCKYGMPITFDPETTKTLSSYAASIHKTPAEIIAAMVNEKITFGSI